MNHNLNRRQLIFLGTALAGAGICDADEKAVNRNQSERLYREPARDIPIMEQADVVVCGAGPAGVAAAISAKSNRLVRDVPWKQVKAGLEKLNKANS